MWWFLLTGCLFCTFQFKWIDPKLDVGWKIATGVGFLILFYVGRRKALRKAIESDRNESLQLIENYQSRFGKGNNVRDVLSGFGEGFGDEYSRFAAESGDILHTVVGHGISVASNYLARASKSREQIAMESRMKILSDQIDAKEKLATGSIFMAMISAIILVWMSVQGSLPL